MLPAQCSNKECLRPITPSSYCWSMTTFGFLESFPSFTGLLQSPKIRGVYPWLVLFRQRDNQSCNYTAVRELGPTETKGGVAPYQNRRSPRGSNEKGRRSTRPRRTCPYRVHLPRVYTVSTSVGPRGYATMHSATPLTVPDGTRTGSK